MELPDGRRLEVLVAGPGNGMPLVLHRGTPSGAVRYRPVEDAAARRGLRTVVWSRPGYGDSTARPGRSVADVAADTAAVLDALGAGRFVTLGMSGGGPHALACAALLPDRCAAAASVAGVAPFRAEGLDWLAGMGPENVEEFTAAAAGEPELVRFLGTQVGVLATVQGPDVTAAFGELVSDVDRHCLTGGSSSPRGSGGPWRTGSPDGATTTWLSSGTGGSRWTGAGRRSRSGRAGRTGWCRTRTASGWPGGSPVPRSTCCPARATCP
jgi:pimeloyl-ACP methyl ester carboxylesterase